MPKSTALDSSITFAASAPDAREGFAAVRAYIQQNPTDPLNDYYTAMLAAQTSHEVEDAIALAPTT